MRVSAISGVETFRFEPHEDSRGLWQRVWDRDVVSVLGFSSDVAQISVSHNPLQGTLRGLHYLDCEVGETKFVFCSSGSVQDVLLDVRAGSPTFGDYVDLQLDPGDGVAIQPGIAHGFLSLKPNSLLIYIMTAQYNQEAEKRILWNDSRFGIKWRRAPMQVSEKDGG